MPQRHPSPPGPARDRALAAAPRLGPRRAVAASQLVEGFMRSAEAKRLRRTRHIVAALRQVLGEDLLGRVEAVSLVQGRLSLAVADTVLLHELRNHRQGEILAALVAAGTGVSRLAFRLARS